MRKNHKLGHIVYRRINGLVKFLFVLLGSKQKTQKRSQKQ